jgi:hypothetical protein
VTLILVVATLLLLGSPGGNGPGPSQARGAESTGREQSSPAFTSKGVAVADIGKRKARVELRVIPTVVGITQVPRAVLVNSGALTVEYSHIFKLERKTIAGWRWINRRQAWILPLLFLRPGESSRPQPIGVWRVNPQASRCPRSPEPCCLRVVLRPGLYRVTKAAEIVTGGAGAPQFVVRATFRVSAAVVRAIPGPDRDR